MNKVYLSGIIADDPILIGREGTAPHLTFNISVSHRSKAGIRSELYRVSAWNNTALWGNANLRRGQGVAIQGYLTQRLTPINGIHMSSVEVSAEEFLPCPAINATYSHMPRTAPPRTERTTDVADDVSVQEEAQ